MDIDSIDIANHEFTGEELGGLLLASVKQMKASKPRLPFTDDDITQMVQAVIDDDPQAEQIRESLTTSLKEVSSGQMGRITYPPIASTREKP